MARRTFRHRSGNRVPVDSIATDVVDNGDSNNNQSGPSLEGSQRKKRKCTKLIHPVRGQRIPIKPLGEE
jgi:hypothetical protein